MAVQYYYGTDGPDNVQSPTGPSAYYLLDGDDTITGAYEPRNKWGDLKGTADVDIVKLGDGDDLALDFNERDSVFGGRGDDTVTFMLIDRAFSYSTPPHSRAYGEDGNDLLTNANVLIGGAGDDTLVSFSGWTYGGAGNDVYRITHFLHDIIDTEGRSDIEIHQPDDTFAGRTLRIITGDAKDHIVLDGVNDCIVRTADRADVVEVNGYDVTVYAGGGNDTVTGAGVVYGANGRDVLSGQFADGGRGNDMIDAEQAIGGAGNDTLSCDTGDGGEGNDSIDARTEGHGGAGDDVMTGRNLYGEDGNDTIDADGIGHGGADDDVITGGGRLVGANGDDTLTGDANSDDLLLGGRGADELRFALNEGSDVMRGDGGPDTYVLTAFEPSQLPQFIDTVDSIEGFEHDLDRIDLRARDGIVAFDDLVIEQVGDFVTVEDAAGYLLVAIVDDNAANFTSNDFVF